MEYNQYDNIFVSIYAWKYRLLYKGLANRIGLPRKHIFDAMEASVKRMGTYIDVLQIHRLDRDTPREEIMRALKDVVESGKVRYIGTSSSRRHCDPCIMTLIGIGLWSGPSYRVQPQYSLDIP
ncbi:potassium channel beta, putative [Talaromyces stipitatus ATCC 10500]|uniref:Potassium channel beta, putative n=1 Tax=Talaromyces stipitatus (strain ATCC 10500 / CBS 375.48 / QM 6759 / NRRL 1006) TaxID=441959 RepID=B8M7F9_TALSN|nr:potassium channel beta, putative [Talaromyces stipitatus ATCC 10500]EED20379.1 potassium channel beta, putative [Talaromyces stipitatus ATCC 10500]